MECRLFFDGQLLHLKCFPIPVCSLILLAIIIRQMISVVNVFSDALLDVIEEIGFRVESFDANGASIFQIAGVWPPEQFRTFGGDCGHFFKLNVDFFCILFTLASANRKQIKTIQKQKQKAIWENGEHKIAAIGVKAVKLRNKLR